jgi:hypothetical protein
MRSLDFFNRPNPSSSTVALGSTQPLIEMSIWNLPRGKGQLAQGSQPYHHLLVDRLEKVGASASHNPMGLQGLLQGQVLHYFYVMMKSATQIIQYWMTG